MELRIDEEKGIARIVLAGPVGEKEILEAFDAAVEHPKYKPGMPRLWDFRRADLSSLDTAAVAALAEYPMRFPKGICDVRVAFVVAGQLEYGLTRMFQAMSEDERTDIGIFYSTEEAESWLLR